MPRPQSYGLDVEGASPSTPSVLWRGSQVHYMGCTCLGSPIATQVGATGAGSPRAQEQLTQSCSMLLPADASTIRTIRAKGADT